MMPVKYIYTFWLVAALFLTWLLPSTVLAAERGTITVHTVSTHVGVDGLNNINPGIGYDYGDVRFGVLYNSFKKPAAYAAYVHQFHPRVRAGFGVISGYQYKERRVYGKTTSVIPMIAIEADITDHVSVLWFGQVLNLEVKF